MGWRAALVLALAVLVTPAGAAELSVWVPPQVAAVLRQIGPQFEREQGHKLRVTVDAPETLAKRIENGEDVDVFVGPETLVNRLVQGKKIQAETRVGVARVATVQWFGGIGVGSKSPEAAWELLKFLTNPDTDPVFKAQGLARD